ncbi:MAG: hypothetical protein QOK00_17 [Thermoleophilaceae bacterium]|nr:hypothetical protein [Thermoleophilaceae bacterium]
MHRGSQRCPEPEPQEAERQPTRIRNRAAMQANVLAGRTLARLSTAAVSNNADAAQYQGFRVRRMWPSVRPRGLIHRMTTCPNWPTSRPANGWADDAPESGCRNAARPRKPPTPRRARSSRRARSADPRSRRTHPRARSDPPIPGKDGSPAWGEDCPGSQPGPSTATPHAAGYAKTTHQKQGAPRSQARLYSDDPLATLPKQLTSSATRCRTSTTTIRARSPSWSRSASRRPWRARTSTPSHSPW